MSASVNSEILRRISSLPKAVIAEVLSIFADFIADFEAQKTQKETQLEFFTAQKTQSVAILQQQKTQNEPQDEAQKTQKTQNEAQNPSERGEGDIFFSSKDREEREEESEGKQPLIGKPSTRMPRAREGFEEFWNAFPKRINKKSALQKYENAIKNGIEKSHILSAVNRYAIAMRSTEKQFIKSPDVWLNKGCYDDELPGAPNGRGQPNQNVPPLVFVKRDTPQWEAWSAYYWKTKGKSPPSSREGGWNFPTEYPPQSEAAE